MASRMGRPSPVPDTPQLTTRQSAYYEAFGELSTERALGMAEGPIPWSSIVAYAQHYHYPVDALLSVIRQMDAAYLTYQQQQLEDA